MDDGNSPDLADNVQVTTPATEAWQKRWRIVGAITIAACAVMAGFGVDMQMLRESRSLFLVYWGVFAILFFVTLYIVALDFRFIRAQHAIEERDLFLQTLGDEKFREALNEAVRSASDDASNDEPNAKR